MKFSRMNLFFWYVSVIYTAHWIEHSQMWYFPLCRIPFTLQIKICVRCRPDRDKQRQKIVNGGDVFGEILFMRKNPSGTEKNARTIALYLFILCNIKFIYYFRQTSTLTLKYHPNINKKHTESRWKNKRKINEKCSQDIFCDTRHHITSFCEDCYVCRWFYSWRLSIHMWTIYNHHFSVLCRCCYAVVPLTICCLFQCLKKKKPFFFCSTSRCFPDGFMAI